jgi:beta-aspartyl-peptidase (threonine type)
MCLVLCAVTAHAAPKPTAIYDCYSAGEIDKPRPGPTEGALLLLGGGDWPVPAFRWFVEKMGHGHLVMLRASDNDDLQQDFLNEIGGAASVETLVFHSRDAASDPHVLDILRRADGIFIGGGDQANYVRYFKGTPLNALHDAHVHAGKPLGGTSAGLAVLGAYSYGAMDGGSLLSGDAMKNPLGSGVTLVRDFLHLPLLSQAITDSHFAIRERWGRLLVFVGRLATEERNPAITGIGIDEKAALCIETSGKARVYSIGRGFAWLVRPQRAPDVLAKKPFTFRDVPVVGVGEESSLDLTDFSVARPAFTLRVSIVNGAFDEPALAALKAAAVTPVPAGGGVATAKWALAIHGGAGVIERGDLTPIKRPPIARDSMPHWSRASGVVLRGSSLDAVEATIRVLEDNPLFNAGRGAVFTAEGAMSSTPRSWMAPRSRPARWRASRAREIPSAWRARSCSPRRTS